MKKPLLALTLSLSLLAPSATAFASDHGQDRYKQVYEQKDSISNPYEKEGTVTYYDGQTITINTITNQEITYTIRQNAYIKEKYGAIAPGQFVELKMNANNEVYKLESTRSIEEYVTVKAFDYTTVTIESDGQTATYPLAPYAKVKNKYNQPWIGSYAKVKVDRNGQVISLEQKRAQPQSNQPTPPSSAITNGEVKGTVQSYSNDQITIQTLTNDTIALAIAPNAYIKQKYGLVQPGALIEAKVDANNTIYKAEIKREISIKGILASADANQVTLTVNGQNYSYRLAPYVKTDDRLPIEAFVGSFVELDVNGQLQVVEIDR